MQLSTNDEAAQHQDLSYLVPRIILYNCFRSTIISTICFSLGDSMKRARTVYLISGVTLVAPYTIGPRLLGQLRQQCNGRQDPLSTKLKRIQEVVSSTNPFHKNPCSLGGSMLTDTPPYQMANDGFCHEMTSKGEAVSPFLP
jgi:hypothetical protein